MLNSKILGPLLGLLVLACVFPAVAGHNTWTLHGPLSGGGPVYAIAAHPNGTTALAGTPRGIFRSTDVGANWTLVEDQLTNPPRRILFNPVDANRVVFSDGALHQSTNAGLSFSTLTGPASVSYIGNIEFAANGTLYVVADAGRLFKAAAPYTSWTELAYGWSPGPTQFITADPTNSQVVYVGIFNQGIYRSGDGGATWAPVAIGLRALSIASFQSLAIDPTQPARLVAA